MSARAATAPNRSRRKVGPPSGDAPVRRVSGKVRSVPAAAVAVVPEVPAPLLRGSGTAEKRAPAAARAGAGNHLRRGSGAAAVAVITEPATHGDGWRHLWLGDTGQGKTWAMRELIAIPGQLVFVHDDKSATPEYPDHAVYFRHPAELRFLSPDQCSQLSAAAFRGDVHAGDICDPDEVAEAALMCARKRIPAMLVIDEWRRVATGKGEAPNVEACVLTGRAMGLSVAAGAQIPQNVGGVMLNSCSSVGLFRVGPAGLNYLDERLYFDREMLEVVPTLAKGDFVIHRPGHPWDRTVYRF